MVPDDLVADTAGMGEWVSRSLSYALSLPPKKPKAPASNVAKKA